MQYAFECMNECLVVGIVGTDYVFGPVVCHARLI